MKIEDMLQRFSCIPFLFNLLDLILSPFSQRESLFYIYRQYSTQTKWQGVGLWKNTGNGNEKKKNCGNWKIMLIVMRIIMK